MSSETALCETAQCNCADATSGDAASPPNGDKQLPAVTTSVFAP
jgi:hypothetical protein